MKNKEDVMKILPHRDPMLLVETVELKENADGVEEAHATYKVRGDEYFLQGHFPGNPVVPGVILVEMMAQSCCVFFEKQEGQCFLTTIQNAKFKSPVKPGDTVNITTRITKQARIFIFAESTIHVDGKLSAMAEFSFAAMPKG